MKIVYTIHSKKKFFDLLVFGIRVTRSQIKRVIEKPEYKKTDNGNKISAVDFDYKHNLRVVYKKEKGDIIIITFYIYRKGRYAEY